MKLAITLALLGLVLATGCTATSTDKEVYGMTDGDHPVMLTAYPGRLGVIYHITEDQWDGGVGKGLEYLDRLMDQYLAEGVSADRVEIHGVYSGKASEHLLTDAAWNRIKGVKTGNPNTALLEKLARRGIAVELCNSRRVANGWAVQEMHPSVTLVSGAFLRVIDLQHRGYAYIKF